MTDKAVTALARAAGLHVEWVDAGGKPQRVAVETLRHVLAALGYPASTKQDVAHSRAVVAEGRQEMPPLLICRPGAVVDIDPRVSRLQLESGEAYIPAGTASFQAPDVCGYHSLRVGERRRVLAVVPERCFTLDDIRRGARFTGIAVQIPSLRGGSTDGFGDFDAVSRLVSEAADLGIDAIMLSPVHALFGARFDRFSPYAPSSRLFLNALLAAIPKVHAAAERSGLIDWPRAAHVKRAALRALFESFDQANTGFRNFCKASGARLLHHALFEALDAHFQGRGVNDARHWPDEFSNPYRSAVSRFARDNEAEVRFALFQQWIAARSLAVAHARAREKMAIGLIADVAVGLDPGGSHAWSASGELLRGLRIGAPPDAFNAAGQDWGLTNFSPQALRRTGFTGFLETVRAAMRHAGGIRLDHAMGLGRLWLLPEGAMPADGVYLTYPRKELLGLLALESVRHRAIVIGEDLGTVPSGFRRVLARAGVLGMQVLWFERDRDGQFVLPRKWRRDAVAMTTTHDLPTVAGWWKERDVDWQERLGHLPASSHRREKARRKTDRKSLWSAFAQEGVAGSGIPPPARPAAAVDAALEFVAATRCQLAIAPLEDLVEATEQPNLPGTLDEHPNWRRRLRRENPLRDRRVRKRVRAILAARDQP